MRHFVLTAATSLLLGAAFGQTVYPLEGKDGPNVRVTQAQATANGAASPLLKLNGVKVPTIANFAGSGAITITTSTGNVVVGSGPTTDPYGAGITTLTLTTVSPLMNTMTAPNLARLQIDPNAYMTSTSIGSLSPVFITKTSPNTEVWKIADNYYLTSATLPTYYPNLQQVTDVGAITTNNMQVGNTFGVGLSLGSNPLIGFSDAFHYLYWNNAATDFEFSHPLTTTRFTSSVAIGTAPFQPVSTTMCPNLNADMVDGKHATDFTLDYVAGNGQTTTRNIGTTGTFTASGNIQGGANGTFAGIVKGSEIATSYTVTASGNVQGGSNGTFAGIVRGSEVATSYTATASGNIQGGSNGTFAGIVKASELATSYTVTASGNVQSGNNITAAGKVRGSEISTSYTVTSSGSMQSGNAVTAAGPVQGSELRTSYTVTASGSMQTANHVTAAGIVRGTSGLSTSGTAVISGATQMAGSIKAAGLSGGTASNGTLGLDSSNNFITYTPTSGGPSTITNITASSGNVGTGETVIFASSGFDDAAFYNSATAHDEIAMGGNMIGGATKVKRIRVYIANTQDLSDTQTLIYDSNAVGLATTSAWRITGTVASVGDGSTISYSFSLSTGTASTFNYVTSVTGSGTGGNDYIVVTATVTGIGEANNDVTGTQFTEMFWP